MSSKTFQQKINDIVESALEKAMEKIDDLNATSDGGTVQETSDALAGWSDFQDEWENWNDV